MNGKSAPTQTQEKPKTAAGSSPVDSNARPCAWVRRNGGFSSGVAHFGAECPPGWTLAAEPLYDKATLDAAVAAERERWEKAAEEMAQEAERKFPANGTVAHWLRALVAKRGA